MRNLSTQGEPHRRREKSIDAQRNLSAQGEADRRHGKQDMDESDKIKDAELCE
jgi:hypothetical protein